MNVIRPSVAVVAVGLTAMLTGCANYGDFTLSTLDGQEISLSEQKGKVVLVAFWGSQ